MKLGIISFLVVALAHYGLGEALTNPQMTLENQQLASELLEHRTEFKSWLTKQFTTSTRVRVEPEAEYCPICRTAVALAIGLIKQGWPPGLVGGSLITLCISLQIVPDDVCRGAVELYINPGYAIFKARDYLTAGDVCGILLQGEPECAHGNVNASLSDWDITIDKNKPLIFAPPRLPDDTPSVKVLHLTDVHPDLHYAEGSPSNCNYPMCCRADLPSNNQTIPAEPWGGYQCDMPTDAMVDAFLDAANRYEDEYGFVLLTGDYVHHAIWETTIEDNIDHFAIVANKLKQALPNTPIFPVIGNHEAHPCNMFPLPEVYDDFDLSWLYNSMADLYEEYLTPEAYATFKYGGYYTAKPAPGLKLIVLNTNMCYTLNFWLLHDTKDPLGQLQWLSDQLFEAEKAKERVWIVGHIPPGIDDCWHVWSKKFINIVNRYESIIMAQYYGHTHNDDFKIFFDKTGSTPRATNTLYIGASTTPYTYLNPGYKVFFADGAREGRTWEILNHETWISDLAHSNTNGKPEWFRLYDAKETYGVKSFRGSDLYDLVVRMVDDEPLFQKFYSHFHKGANDQTAPCDTHECKMTYLCALVTTDIDDLSMCDHLEQIAKSRQPRN